VFRVDRNNLAQPRRSLFRHLNSDNRLNLAHRICRDNRRNSVRPFRSPSLGP
jgi:hypothetical protein